MINSFRFVNYIIKMQGSSTEEQLRKSAEDFRRNKTQISLRRLDQLIQQKPYDIVSYLNKSSILASLNQMQEAEIILKKAIEISPYDYRLHYNMFVIHFRTQSWNLALSSLKCTLSALNLIRIKQNQKEAETFLRKSKDFWAQNLQTYVQAAVFHSNNQCVANAIDWINEGIQAIGEDNRLLKVRAYLYVKEGLISKAVRDLQMIKQCSVVNQKGSNERGLERGECEEEVRRLLKEMKILFSQMNECINSKMYSFPQNVLFLENSEVGAFDFDSIISEYFPTPDLRALQSSLPDSKLQSPIIHSLPYHYPIQQNVHSTTFQMSPKNQNPNSVQVVSPIQLYPLKFFRKIQVKIKKANLTNDTEFIGKMDPYIIVTYSDNQQHQTKTIKGGGTIPEWEDDSKVYVLAKKPSFMKFEVWDHQSFKRDDFVGKGQIQIRETGEQVVEIFSGKKEAGEIYIWVVGLE